MNWTITRMWFAKFARMKKVIASLLNDPHTRGKVEKLAGFTLVADGLVGLENPLNGKTARLGILGGLLLFLFGIPFLLLGSFVAGQGKPLENGATVTGRVAEVRRGTGSESDSCSRIIEYRIKEQTYTKTERGTSSLSCNDVGQEVMLSYMPDTPGNARIIDNGVEVTGTVFAGIGLFVMGSALLFTLTKLSEVVLGVVLWLKGRKRMRDNPPTAESNWMALLQSAWSGSSPEPALRPASSADSTPPPAQRQLPPPGFYSDKSSPTGNRWWDGTKWTDRT